MTQKNTKTIPAGYKQTEIGMIPVDWDAMNLSSLGFFRGGSGFPLKYQGGKTGQYPFYKVSDMNNIGNSVFMFDANHWISEDVRKQMCIKTLPARTIVFAKIGAAIFLERKKILSRESCIDNNMMGFVIDERITNPRFIHYLFLKISLGKLVSATALPSLNGKQIGELKYGIPKYPEQTAIATVLSDADALIEKLEKLIAKKKAIKQAVMQQLLTGKKRLPGFSEKWEVKKLRKACNSIKTGKLDANAMVTSGEYRFYTCAKEYSRIDKYAFDTEALLISGNGANVGYIHYYKGRFNAYQRTYVLFDFLESIAFIKLLLDKNLQERIRIEVNAGNTPYITMGTLTDMDLSMPSSKEEQNAIATIFSDMDSEIEKLENKLNKYHQIKIGMMQQLLTGKIRLIKE